jgi:hypothetical protein
MRVKILEHVPGLLDGDPFPAKGAIVELPAGLAVSLVRDNRAEPVATAEKRETAAVATTETRKTTRARKTA